MILRIRRLLVKDLNRLSIQVHELALESQPVNVSNTRPVIRVKEQRQAISIAKRGPLDGNSLHIVELRQMQFLSRLEVTRRTEIQVISIQVNFER